MRVLHISDLHIGKRVNERLMIEDQKHILDQIVELSGEADITLLSGDIYDKSQPSAEAIETFDGFLRTMHRKGRRVAMIYGNHDKPELIAYASGILSDADIYTSPVYCRENHEIRSFTVPDEHGFVTFWLMPFLKPAHVREALEDDSIKDDTTAIAKVIETMHIDPEARNVLLAHQFVTGASVSGSEEMADLQTVGGLEGVNASVFKDFTYVALGHIHGHQKIQGTDGRVRYCGSQLCYDKSEVKDGTPTKVALMVTIGAEGVESVEEKPLTPLHPMRLITGKTLKELYSENEISEDYVYVILADNDIALDAQNTLKKLFPNCLFYTYEHLENRIRENVEIEIQEDMPPIKWFSSLFNKVIGQDMNEEQLSLIQKLIDEIEEA